MHPASIVLQPSSQNLRKMLICVTIRQGALSPSGVQVPLKVTAPQSMVICSCKVSGQAAARPQW